MVDIHFHGLYGVDDGPKTVEESMKLIDCAYNQGTRMLVLTPHYHHPLDFGWNGIERAHIEAYFQDLKQQAQRRYEHLELLLGAENYISRDRIGNMDRAYVIPYPGTKSVLIEFSRDIRLHQMDDAIYELKALGYRPILAHVEVYEKLVSEMTAHDYSRLIQWVEDGVGIQVNAENLLLKSNLANLIESMIEQGLVHFLASDAHNMETRAYRLKEAANHLRKKYGEVVSQSLISANGQRLLKDETLLRIMPNRQSGGKKVLAATMLTLLVGLSGWGSYMTLKPVDDQGLTVVAAQDEKGDTQLVEMSVGGHIVLAEDGVELSTQTDDSGQSDQTTTFEQGRKTETVEAVMDKTDQELEIVTEKERVTNAEAEELERPLEVESGSVLEQIVELYEIYLEDLKQEYLAEVDGYYKRLVDVAGWEESLEQEQEVDRIMGMIGMTEDVADHEVYKSLYDLQNDLEDQDQDVSVVQKMREAYLQMKVDVSEDYENRLRSIRDAQKNTQ